MARTANLALSVGLALLVGCNSSELADLRSAVTRHRKEAEGAKAELAAVKVALAAATARAEEKLAGAEQQSRDAMSLVCKATSERAAAEQGRIAALAAKSDAEARLDSARALENLVAAQRADLARDLAAAANTIKSAETAKAISAAVNRMATQARQDRAHAEKLLAEVKHAREVIGGEAIAAAKEQRAASAVVAAARMEKQAAEDAVEAATLAKAEVGKDRDALSHERTLLADARDELEGRSAAARALLAKAEAKKLAAEQARIKATKQQVILAEQIAALEAAKEAATISQVASEQARMLAASERKVADRAKASAEVARKEAASSYDSVRSVIEQLRGIQAQGANSDAPMLPPVKVAESAAAVLGWLHSSYVMAAPLAY